MSTKTFRVFISSTFKDFEEERKLLKTTVTERMEEICSKSGFHFEFVDLQFGITYEADLSNQIVPICLEEIKKCQSGLRPAFLILAGERYGSISLPHIISVDQWNKMYIFFNEDERVRMSRWYKIDTNRKPAAYLIQPRIGNWGKQDIWEEEKNLLMSSLQRAASQCMSEEEYFSFCDCSITEHEIKQGLFSCLGERENTVIMFRHNGPDFLEIQSSDLKKQERLKERIKSIPLTNQTEPVIYDYDYRDFVKNKDVFVEEVTRQMKALVTQTMEVRIDEESESIQYAKDQSAVICGREPELREINKYLDQPAQKILLIKGEPGSGKSTILSEVYNRFIDTKDRNNSLCLAYFPDQRNASHTLLTVFQKILNQLSHVYNGIPERISYYKHLETFQNVLNELAKSEKEILIILDAIDRYSDRELFDDPLFDFTLPANVHMAISSTPDVQYLFGMNTDILPVGAMSETDFYQAFQLLLSNKHRKISSAQEAVLAPFLKGKYLPIQVKLLSEYCLHLRSSDCLNLSGMEHRDLVQAFIENLIRNLHHEENYVKRCLALLSVAPDGLTISELLELVSKDQCVYNAFVEDRHKIQNQDSRKQNIPTVLPDIYWYRLEYDLGELVQISESHGSQIICFSHMIIPKVIKELLPELTNKAKQDLILYFQAVSEKKEDGNPNLRKAFSYIPLIENCEERIIEELDRTEFVNLMISSGQLDYLMKLYGLWTEKLKNPNIYSSILRHNQTLQFFPSEFERLLREDTLSKETTHNITYIPYQYNYDYEDKILFSGDGKYFLYIHSGIIHVWDTIRKQSIWSSQTQEEKTAVYNAVWLSENTFLTVSRLGHIARYHVSNDYVVCTAQSYFDLKKSFRTFPDETRIEVNLELKQNYRNLLIIWHVYHAGLTYNDTKWFSGIFNNRIENRYSVIGVFDCNNMNFLNLYKESSISSVYWNHPDSTQEVSIVFPNNGSADLHNIYNKEEKCKSVKSVCDSPFNILKSKKVISHSQYGRLYLMDYDDWQKGVLFSWVCCTAPKAYCAVCPPDIKNLKSIEIGDQFALLVYSNMILAFSLEDNKICGKLNFSEVVNRAVWHIIDHSFAVIMQGQIRIISIEQMEPISKTVMMITSKREIVSMITNCDKDKKVLREQNHQKVIRSCYSENGICAIARYDNQCVQIDIPGREDSLYFGLRSPLDKYILNSMEFSQTGEYLFLHYNNGTDIIDLIEEQRLSSYQSKKVKANHIRRKVVQKNPCEGWQPVEINICRDTLTLNYENESLESSKIQIPLKNIKLMELKEQLDLQEHYLSRKWREADNKKGYLIKRDRINWLALPAFSTVLCLDFNNCAVLHSEYEETGITGVGTKSEPFFMDRNGSLHQLNKDSKKLITDAPEDPQKFVPAVNFSRQKARFLMRFKYQLAFCFLTAILAICIFFSKNTQPVVNNLQITSGNTINELIELWYNPEHGEEKTNPWEVLISPNTTVLCSNDEDFDFDGVKDRLIVYGSTENNTLYIWAEMYKLRNGRDWRLEDKCELFNYIYPDAYAATQYLDGVIFALNSNNEWYFGYNNSNSIHPIWGENDDQSFIKMWKYDKNHFIEFLDSEYYNHGSQSWDAMDYSATKKMTQLGLTVDAYALNTGTMITQLNPSLVILGGLNIRFNHYFEGLNPIPTVNFEEKEKACLVDNGVVALMSSKDAVKSFQEISTGEYNEVDEIEPQLRQDVNNEKEVQLKYTVAGLPFEENMDFGNNVFYSLETKPLAEYLSEKDALYHNYCIRLGSLSTLGEYECDGDSFHIEGEGRAESAVMGDNSFITIDAWIHTSPPEHGGQRYLCILYLALGNPADQDEAEILKKTLRDSLEIRSGEKRIITTEFDIHWDNDGKQEDRQFIQSKQNTISLYNAFILNELDKYFDIVQFDVDNPENNEQYCYWSSESDSLPYLIVRGREKCRLFLYNQNTQKIQYLGDCYGEDTNMSPILLQLEQELTQNPDRFEWDYVINLQYATVVEDYPDNIENQEKSQRIPFGNHILEINQEILFRKYGFTSNLNNFESPDAACIWYEYSSDSEYDSFFAKVSYEIVDPVLSKTSNMIDIGRETQFMLAHSMNLEASEENNNYCQVIATTSSVYGGSLYCCNRIEAIPESNQYVRIWVTISCIDEDIESDSFKQISSNILQDILQSTTITA